MIEHHESKHASYEFELIEVFQVDTIGGVNLQRIVIVRQILEQHIAGVDLVQEEEEDATIIKRVFAFKHQALPEVLGPKTHNRREAVLEHPRTRTSHLASAKLHRQMGPEIHHLTPIVPFILPCVRVDG